MSAPEVCVVVVNHNTRDETIAAVASLREATRARVEIVVVDNGSRDGSVAALRDTFGDTVTVVDAGANLGFAAGVNLGARVGSAEYVLLLNPDTTVLAGAVDALLDFAREHPRHGVYGGRTLRQDGTTDPSSCWGEMTLWSLFCFATLLSTVRRRSALFDPESLGRWQRDTVREVPIVTGCLLLIARQDWDELGGMDERFFLYGEDADFSARARERGMRPVIVPEATIVHAVGGSTASGGTKMCMVMAGRTTLLRVRWHPLPARIGTALLLAGAGARAGLERLRGRRARWSEVWRRRRDWSAGYPRARAALFGTGSGAPRERESTVRST